MILVNADDFSLLRSAKRASRDVIDDHKEDEGHDGSVRADRDGVGELNAELTVVVVDPASRDDGESIEESDAAVGEETSAESADESSDTVGGEDIEGVIEVEDVLELGGIWKIGEVESISCFVRSDLTLVGLRGERPWRNATAVPVLAPTLPKP